MCQGYVECVKGMLSVSRVCRVCQGYVECVKGMSSVSRVC